MTADRSREAMSNDPIVAGIEMDGGLGTGLQHLLPGIRRATLGGDAGPLGAMALGLGACTGIADGG